VIITLFTGTTWLTSCQQVYNAGCQMTMNLDNCCTSPTRITRCWTAAKIQEAHQLDMLVLYVGKSQVYQVQHKTARDRHLKMKL